MNDFVSAAGPVDRFVVRLGGIGNQAENAIPGGVSGVPESPFYTNLLGPWLTNESFRFGPCGAGCGAPEILVPDHATSPSQ